MHLLFVCGRGAIRSPTAEQVFADLGGIETRSAGMSSDADQPLTLDEIEWADLILVMEETHRAKLTRAFGPQLRDKRIGCLDIADDYDLMDDALIRLLWERVPRFVPGLTELRPKS